MWVPSMNQISNMSDLFTENDHTCMIYLFLSEYSLYSLVVSDIVVLINCITIIMQGQVNILNCNSQNHHTKKDTKQNIDSSKFKQVTHNRGISNA